LPKYGKVEIDPNGNWTYTPNIEAVEKANIGSSGGVYFVDSAKQLDPTGPKENPDPNSSGRYSAAIALDTGTYYNWNLDKLEWGPEVGGPPRFDRFTITAYDSNKASVLYSVPITVNFARLRFHLAYRTDAGGALKEVFVWPDGYQWTYTATAPVNGGKVDI